MKAWYLSTNLLGVLLAATIWTGCTKKDPLKPEVDESFPAYIRGCDLSALPAMRALKVKYENADGATEDPLTTLQNAGMNVVRLKLWTSPSGYSSLDSVAQFADEIHRKGMRVWISVHYSDTWADPGAQALPAAWANLSFDRLKDSLHSYTAQVVERIKPDYIQIGNEINQGLLWPVGHFNHPVQMRALLSEGIRATRDVSPETKIMLHYAGFQDAAAFFEPLKNLDFDIIGLSYYPFWHGKNIAQLSAKIIELADTHKKQVVIAETSYPFSLLWADWTNNIVGDTSQLIPEFPASPEGQQAFLNTLDQAIQQANGLGWCYWGADMVAGSGAQSTDGSVWENQSFWDFNLKALPVIEAFSEK